MIEMPIKVPEILDYQIRDIGARDETTRSDKL
jgi:hypothetical protein